MKQQSLPADQLATLAMEYIAKGLPIPQTYREMLGKEACETLDELERITLGSSQDDTQHRQSCILAEVTVVGSA